MSLYKSIPNPFDTFHKTLKVGRIPFIVKYLYPEIEDVINVSTELPSPHIPTKSSDCIIETKDAIYIVEFQTGPKRFKDLCRFISYNLLVLSDDNYNVKAQKPVYSVPIYTEKFEKNLVFLNGSIITLFKSSSLKDIDGDEILEELRVKIENEIELNWKEKGLLEYIPFFKSKRSPKELLTETIKLTTKEKFLTDTEKENIRARQMLLIAHFTKNEKEFQEMKKMIETIEDVKQLIRDEYKEEYEEKGKREGIMSTAKAMLEDNSPIDKIVKYTGLSEKEIKNIQY